MARRQPVDPEQRDSGQRANRPDRHCFPHAAETKAKRCKEGLPGARAARHDLSDVREIHNEIYEAHSEKEQHANAVPHSKDSAVVLPIISLVVYGVPQGLVITRNTIQQQTRPRLITRDESPRVVDRIAEELI